MPPVCRPWARTKKVCRGLPLSDLVEEQQHGRSAGGQAGGRRRIGQEERAGGGTCFRFESRLEGGWIGET
jgi:hypothetical protein